MALSRWVGRRSGWMCTVTSVWSRSARTGEVRSAGRVASTPEGLEMFAESLLASDRVALEVTGSCWEVARILEPHVARVVVVSPDDTGICRRGRRPTGWTRGRWRGCCGRGSWSRCGCPTSAAA